MKWKITIAVVTIFVLGSLFYATPHITLWRMKAAAEAGDYEKFSQFVDYPKLRESAKQSLIESGVLDRALERGTGNRALDVVASALASPVMNAAIDAAISPQSLALLMQGKSWAEARSSNRVATGRASEPLKIDVAMNYVNLNEFSVRVSKQEGTSKPSLFTLSRDGWFSWKLSSIQLALR